MVPTLTCGLVRAKTSLAIAPPLFLRSVHRRLGPAWISVVDVSPTGIRYSLRPQSCCWDLNPETSSLPMKCSTIELQQHLHCLPKRVKGIEPSYLVWKTNALPLSYTRGSGQGGIRTPVRL